MGIYKALLLAGCGGALGFAAPAVAQDAAAVEEADPIIVTGSRIQRADFENNSPTVTADESLFENSSTAALEVNLNKLPQFTPAQTPQLGADIQPTATNTPGAATESLRTALGEDRPHPLPTFDMGPPLETILANCLEETGLPAPRAPIPR